MENFIEIIAYAGIVLIYIISRLLQGKKQKTDSTPQPQTGEESTTGPKKPTPFEEFLQELRGEEETQQYPEQKPASEDEPEDHPFSDKKRRQAPEREQGHDQPTEHPAPRAETEGRKPVKGTLEEKYGEEIKRQPGMEGRDDAGDHGQGEKGKKSHAKAHYYREMLKNTAGARKAIVLSEILKPHHF